MDLGTDSGPHPVHCNVYQIGANLYVRTLALVQLPVLSAGGISPLTLARHCQCDWLVDVTNLTSI